MHTKKYILAVSVAMCSVQLISAQTITEDTIAKRSVVIERDYTPTVQEAQKLSIDPVISEPEIKKEPVNYSDKITLLNPDFEINRWQAAATRIEPVIAQKGYALLGAGVYGAVFGDLLYPIASDAEQSLTLNAHLSSLFGNNQRLLAPKIGLTYKHDFEPLTLNVGVHFNYTGFNYYGTNGLGFSTANYKDSTNHFINFGLRAGIASKNTDEDALHYALSVRYNNFSFGQGMSEQQIHTSGNIEGAVSSFRIGVSAEMYNLFYSSTGDAYHYPYLSYTANNYPNHLVLGLNPYIKFVFDPLTIKIGLKDYLNTSNIDRKTSMMPDVDIHYSPFKTVTIYGGLGGEYTVNTMERVTDENRYILPDLRINNSYAPFSIYGGIKLTPTKGWLINGYVDYKMYQNDYFYVNQVDYYYGESFMWPSPLLFINVPLFTVQYDKADLFTAALQTSYNWRDMVTVHAGINYNNWKMNALQYAWMRPGLEFEAGIEAKVNRHLFLNANFHAAGQTHAYVNGYDAVAMNNVNDLSLGASYLYGDRLTFFIRANNILSNKSQVWYGYDRLGVNGQIGIAVNF